MGGCEKSKRAGRIRESLSEAMTTMRIAIYGTGGVGGLFGGKLARAGRAIAGGAE